MERHHDETAAGRTSWIPAELGEIAAAGDDIRDRVFGGKLAEPARRDFTPKG